MEHIKPQSQFMFFVLYIGPGFESHYSPSAEETVSVALLAHDACSLLFNQSLRLPVFLLKNKAGMQVFTEK